MADIKVKEVGKKTIKTLDKGVIATERLKDTIVHTKEKAESTQSNDSDIVEDGSNKITFVANRTVDETLYHFNKYGKKAVVETKDNVIKTKVKIKNIKDKLLAQKNKKVAAKGAKTTIKTGKSVTKKTGKVTKESVKASQRALKLARETAKQTARATKVVVKATISAIKGIIATTKALISLLVAGGWVAMIVIIIICLTGLLVGSIFGIFFSSEKTNSSLTMNSVITEINEEVELKIENIKNSTIHDECIIANDISWKTVLSVYAVHISSLSDRMELVTLDQNKKETIRKIFWSINSISFELKDEKNTSNSSYNQEENQLKKKVLYIKLISKTIDEIILEYNFNSKQLKELEELMDKQNDTLWMNVIYGVSLGTSSMVKIALQEVGNIGGEKYWRWYGFNERVEWCAIFVSWVANEAGLIKNQAVPKFSICQDGIDWYKEKNRWKENGYVPMPGDIIFFDWENDGNVNHVGIVERVENDVIYTVEGNSTNDTCKRQNYPIKSNVILGYGTSHIT